MKMKTDCANAQPVQTEDKVQVKAWAFLFPILSISFLSALFTLKSLIFSLFDAGF